MTSVARQCTGQPTLGSFSIGQKVVTSSDVTNAEYLCNNLPC